MVCNEDGFTDEDVQALCDVCQSTKNTTDAIGRKGLGFKSVFKACHLVHIGSNGFQFCFDGDDGDFGKVKPTWRVYPEWLRDPQKTYMSLKLSAREDPSDIRRGIQTLEPSVLLFLRNLERITIQTPGFHKLMTCKDRGQEVTTITTETWEEDGESACESMEYVMVRASSGFSTPQLILAFPCPNDGGSEPQQVHTFLPIRSYGFKVGNTPHEYFLS